MVRLAGRGDFDETRGITMRNEFTAVIEREDKWYVAHASKLFVP